jgi:hypothetical protein
MEAILNVIAIGVFLGVVLGIAGYVAYVVFLTALATGERFQERRVRDRQRREQALSPYEQALLNIKKLEAELDFDHKRGSPP